VGFMTVSPAVRQRLRPLHAGWYAGDDVWQSIYGPAMKLAENGRRFDISPAWQAFVGAAPALEFFASLDMHALHTHASALADRLLESLDLAPRGQSLIALHDSNTALLAAVRQAGLTASGRDGRLRLAFHVWNDDTDVLRASDALRSVRAPRRGSLITAATHPTE
jgi:selenocysteine lyase/cysteine desulfurase